MAREANEEIARDRVIGRPVDGFGSPLEQAPLKALSYASRKNCETKRTFMLTYIEHLRISTHTRDETAQGRQSVFIVSLQGPW